MKTTTMAMSAWGLMTVLSAGQAAAAFIVQPTAATASSTMGANYAPVKAIDGSGLATPPPTVNTLDPIPSPWPTFDLTQEDCWISGTEAFGPDKWISFDLGAAYNVTGFHLWNYNNENINSIRGAKEVAITYSADGTVWTNSATLDLIKATSGYGYTGDDYSLTPLVARYVKFQVNSNYGDTNNLAGIGEVRFIAVPEPAALGLLAAGLGLALRRKRA